MAVGLSWFVSLFPALNIEVLLQLFGRDTGLHTFGRHCFGAPEQGVEDDFAEVFVAPVGVIHRQGFGFRAGFGSRLAASSSGVTLD